MDLASTHYINFNDSSSSPVYHQSKDLAFQTKVIIVIVFVIICIIGGIIMGTVQVNNDYNQLIIFYKGYMGRKLFLKERQGLLLSQVLLTLF